MEGIRYRVITLPEVEEDILTYKKAGNKENQIIVLVLSAEGHYDDK